MSALLSTPLAAHAGGVLIASPNRALRQRLFDRVNGRARPIEQALGGADALAQLEKGNWQVLFLDRRLPDLDAHEVMAIIQRRFPGIEVELVDSDLTLDKAPSDKESVRDLERSEATQAPAARNGEASTLCDDVRAAETLPGMVGASPAMQRVYRLVRLVAPRSTTVLIAGATGTGKELVARALHELSPRARKPLVVVNCAAIPESLLESELFGYTRGAFTGAVQSQIGRIPAAHGGTLFLDEVSELPLGMQAKLLRFLEQKEIQRLGTAEAMRVDVRVLAASNVDLAGRAARGAFRQDLFYRLAALAARREDVVPLAEHFLDCMAAAMAGPKVRLSAEAIRILEAHSWHGNVRELQHVMERASILVEDGDVVEARHLYFSEPQRLVNVELPLEACDK